MYSMLKQMTSRLLDLALPATSALKPDLVSSAGALPPQLWQDLHFISGSLCTSCGRPLPQTLLTDIHCGACEISKPLIGRLRSALIYNDASRDLILNFKYGGHMESLHAFASWMHAAAKEILQAPAILVPVPLHTRRRMQRKFNQSALLAQTLAGLCHLPNEPMWLIRHRNTPIQGVLSTSRRINNVKNAFRVPDRMRQNLQDKHIVLIDDVYTSGATLNSCAKTLLAAGVKTVDAITLARVVKLDEPAT